MADDMSPAVRAAVLWLGTQQRGLRETAEVAVLAAAPHIAAKALRAAADDLDRQGIAYGYSTAARALRRRADAIEAGSDG